jgi:5-methylcytosine-specific restriction endonuclease McrA
MRVHWKVWDQVFERDNGICFYCTLDLTETFNSWMGATVDHIQHISIGGGDELSNLVLSCSACNTILSRSAHLITKEQRKEYLNKRRPEFQQRYKAYKKPWASPPETRTLGDDP